MEKKKKTRLGRVLSNRMDKTVVVEVETRHRHSRYKKVVRRKTKFKVHDGGNTCGIGDLVRIVETRPLSREKRWRVDEVLVKAETVEVKPEEIE